MSTLNSLFTQFVASSLTKQFVLDTYLGKHEWQLDLETQQVDFGEGRVFEVQILGSESDITNTWLWSWANPEIQLSPKAIKTLDKLRSLGRREDVSELYQQNKLPLGTVSGHYLSLLASGVCQADAYYRGPYDGGAVFFLISGLPKADRPTTILQIDRIISEVISTWDVSHRPMIQAYLEQEKFNFSSSRNRIIASAPDGRSITFTFDQLGRLDTTLF